MVIYTKLLYMKDIKNDFNEFSSNLKQNIFPCQIFSESFQPSQAISSSNPGSLNPVIYAKYDLSKTFNRTINFISDYSNFLKEKDIKDPTLENFKRREKSEKNKIKKATNELPLINLEYGNYDEALVMKSFSRRKRQRKPKCPSETQSKKEKTNTDESSKRKRKVELAPFEIINTINTNIRDSSNLDETDSKNAKNTNNGKNTNNNSNNTNIILRFPSLKKVEMNQEIDDEKAFDDIMRDLLKINDLPKEAKDKLTLLKRFIPIYKRVRNDSNKFHNFTKKISENLKEPVEEMTVSI
jgi:hypothetical protein